MSALISSLRERNPLPEGTLVVGVGLAVTGVASYLYLVLAGRFLGPAEFGGLSVLWALVFLIGGVFLPFEQEVSRQLVGREVAGVGGRPVIRRALAVGAGLVGAMVLVIALAAPALTDRLFSGDTLLVVGLMLGTAGYLVANLTEGVLSGNRSFVRYGVYLGGEASVRLALGLVLLLVGVRTAGPIGLALGLAPLLVVGPVVWGQTDELARPGPDIPWRALVSALGGLLAASVLAQVLVNASPILVQVLAGPDRQAEVGVFTAALVVARVPLFLFQAVQAALLPTLTGLAAAERFEEFRRTVRRLVGVVAALVVVGTTAGFVVGPQVIERVFGADFPVDRQTVGLLAAASGGFILAMALSQAVMALGASGQVAVGWAVGVVTLLAVVALAVGQDPVTRVSIAFVAGTWAATLAMALVLRSRLTHGATMRMGPVLEAINDIPFEA